ncbi:membrane protein [Chitiniphilus shinanonensis]|uniref:Membrane protein n=1 Tax=Chitiniphilus shinanonensis TaxID=553088 RepID=A0ABQ6BNH0_9NEIS|nr:DUF2818 family protein [Chitiniphilus shinanonensis]GLS03463.1 membrane protein [Chitiniphilus shinanonensis]
MVELYVLYGLAVVAANLPFLTERICFAVQPSSGRKAFGWRALELAVLYLLVGALALALEQRLSPIHAQKWPFYVTTLCLFVVAAFPGFVWRYFWRKPGL